MKTSVRLSIILSLFFYIPLMAQQSLTLREAVNVSLKHNETIKRYRAKVSEKDEEREAAFGNYLPKVTLVGSYTYMGDNLKINMSHVKKSLDEIVAHYGVEIGNGILPVPLPPDNFYNAILSDLQKLPAYNLEIDKQHYPTANLTLIQPLFTGGKITAGSKFAEAEYTEANVEVKKITDETIRDVIKLYLGVVLLEQVVETRENVVEGIKKHRETAEKLVLEGVIAKYQLLRAEVALAKAESELEDELNNLALAKLALNAALGFGNDTTFVLCDKLKFAETEIDVNEGIDTAYANQPLLQLIEQKKIMVRQKINAEKSNLFPTIFAFGELGFFRYDMPGLIQPPWIIGVGMKYEVFSGLKDYHKIESAKHLGEQLEFADKDAKNKIVLWINKAYKEISNAKTKYRKLAANIELAEEALRMANRRFEEGYGTSLEVIDATLQLQGERIKRAAALYEYYQALTEYYMAIGKTYEAVELFEKAQ